jgi:hypothetical protein
MPNRNQPGACLVATAKELWRTLFQAAFGLLLFPLISVAADSAESKGKLTREYDLKAVFLFNFAQFVEWPAEALPKEDSPLTIGVLGDNPFGTALDEAVRNEKINKHPLEVAYFPDIKAVRRCHVLFIRASNPARLKAIFADLRGRSILTVGESDAFLGSGGMIRFVTENKVRLQINLKAAKQARLKISSKLLRVAEVVSND